MDHIDISNAVKAIKCKAMIFGKESGAEYIIFADDLTEKERSEIIAKEGDEKYLMVVPNGSMFDRGADRFWAVLQFFTNYCPTFIAASNDPEIAKEIAIDNLTAFQISTQKLKTVYKIDLEEYGPGKQFDSSLLPDHLNQIGLRVSNSGHYVSNEIMVYEIKLLKIIL